MKSVFKNIFSLGIVDILSLLIPFIIMPYIVGAIGVDYYGRYIFLLLLLFYVTLLLTIPLKLLELES